MADQADQEAFRHTTNVAEHAMLIGRLGDPAS
jgi:hypothetical protein